MGVIAGGGDAHRGDSAASRSVVFQSPHGNLVVALILENRKVKPAGRVTRILQPPRRNV